jgi:hypothetical protein
LDRNEAIVTKIRGLLAIANDGKDDEESQSAFVMAQKLMFKYDIAMDDVEESTEQANNRTVEDGMVTVYKKLFWWERQLATIISTNFRCKWYYKNKFDNNTTKRAITFMGFKGDIELAKEMYILSYDVLTFYAKRFVDNEYETTYYFEGRNVTRTNDLKNSYMMGFLKGLGDKFKRQVAEMQQENALMVLIPNEVVEAYDKEFGNRKGLNWSMPKIAEVDAYQQGYYEGERVDYTKRTIDDDILV